ncbi:MAG: hypothetical protein IJL05_01175 [Alphaproteobacteria bacterium]|nr:hypothetical protein [Alphaproteobacteria bacterium]
MACRGLAETSAFAKAPVGQSLWAKIFIGVIIVIIIVVACVFTFGAAGGGAAAGIAAITAATAAAIAAAMIISVAVTSADAQKKETQTAQEIEELRQKAAFANTESHGEQVSFEWNYMEKITTDFDRDTMICKRCIVSRHCNTTSWSVFSDRYCKSWGKWEEPKCNELKF